MYNQFKISDKTYVLTYVLTAGFTLKAYEMMFTCNLRWCLCEVKNAIVNPM